MRFCLEAWNSPLELLQWGESDVKSEYPKEITIPITTKKIISGQASMKEKSNNSNGVNTPSAKIYYGYNNQKIILTADVIYTRETNRNLTMSYFLICI